MAVLVVVPAVLLCSRVNAAHRLIHAQLKDGGDVRPQLLPVDDASGLPRLQRVVNRLRAAVAARDVEALRPLLAPMLSVHFERGYTPDEFVAYVRSMPKEDRHTLWRDLRDAVNLGAARSSGPKNVVLLPYTAALAEGTCSDVITGARVALRAAPAREAPVLEWLSYDCVEEDDAVTDREAPPIRIDGFEYAWTPIITSGGRRGWVSSRYFRGLFSFRILLEEIDGDWKIAALAAGD